MQAKVVELQSALLAAQSSALEATTAQFVLQERVRELEGKLRAVDDWQSVASRYALVNPWRGPAQAYALKRTEARGEEPHFLCTNCFHAGKRVILNPATAGRVAVMMCPSCKAIIQTGYAAVAAAKYAEDVLAKRAGDPVKPAEQLEREAK